MDKLFGKKRKKKKNVSSKVHNTMASLTATTTTTKPKTSKKTTKPKTTTINSPSCKRMEERWKSSLQDKTSSSTLSSTRSTQQPIWERENEEREQREAQERRIRERNKQLAQEVERTQHLVSNHPGLLKTVYKVTISVGGTGLPKYSHDTIIWSCCFGLLSQEPCENYMMSDLHSKCTRCGSMYLEFENTDAALLCTYHPGRCVGPVDNLRYECCMASSFGCKRGRHTSAKRNTINRAKTVHSLPLGWKEITDKLNICYYHPETGVSQWDPPKSDSLRKRLIEASEPDLHQQMTRVANLTKGVSDFHKAKSEGKSFKEAVQPSSVTSSTSNSSSPKEISTLSQNSPNETSEIKQYRVLYDYHSEDPGFISFEENDIIFVFSQDDSGWWQGLVLSSGQSGWFPSNFVTEIDESEEEESDTDTSQEEENPFTLPEDYENPFACSDAEPKDDNPFSCPFENNETTGEDPFSDPFSCEGDDPFAAFRT